MDFCDRRKKNVPKVTDSLRYWPMLLQKDRFMLNARNDLRGFLSDDWRHLRRHVLGGDWRHRSHAVIRHTLSRVPTPLERRRLFRTYPIRVRGRHFKMTVILKVEVHSLQSTTSQYIYEAARPYSVISTVDGDIYNITFQYQYRNLINEKISEKKTPVQLKYSLCIYTECQLLYCILCHFMYGEFLLKYLTILNVLHWESHFHQLIQYYHREFYRKKMFLICVNIQVLSTIIHVLSIPKDNPFTFLQTGNSKMTYRFTVFQMGSVERVIPPERK